MTKDYYKILDIPEFSTQDEIKCAYRKLARRWHPDVAGNTESVITRFKEINEAYEVLSNLTKKADYDTAKRFYDYAKSEPKTNNKSENEQKKNTTSPNSKERGNSKKEKSKFGGFSFDWEEFIAKKYRESRYKKEQEAKAPKRGNDIFTDVEISVFEAIEGTTKVVNMLQTQVCPKCGGRKFVNGGKCSCCDGKGEVSQYKRFTVKIPKGIKSGSKIRLAEEGEKGLNGGKAGDLYLTVHVKPNSDFKTEGLNVYKTLTIEPYEAVLGANIKVSTLSGNVSVKISPNTKNGQKIRLSGCGLEQGNEVGDMILTIEIQIPEKLSNEEIELYKKLSELSTKVIK